MKTAVWENVYTYAVQAGGQQSKTSSSSNYNYAEYKDVVYYIVPNPELKIDAESAPFDFISMKDGQEITEDINRRTMRPTM